MSLLLLLIAEIVVRVVKPQVIFFPRFQYSPQYGNLPYKNTTMKMMLKGRFEHRFVINELGYRGKLTPIKENYDKTNIVALGDSYTFGIGVNQGEEYPAIINKKLDSLANVINLGVSNWGLTQQIRRYYEFGQLYKPKIVILQFCKNDPKDNFVNNVLEIHNNSFKFRNTSNKLNQTKIYLSKSIIQKSHLYNIIRNSIFRWHRKKFAQQNPKKDNAWQIQKEQEYYNQLLTNFAYSLKHEGVILLMISVNGELNEFPEIMKMVLRLQAEDQLHYIEVEPWFKGVTDYSSPEGHKWGKKGHLIIGNELSKIIRDKFLLTK